MTFIDTIIILIFIAGIVIGYMRGVISQVTSIVGFLLGILACLLLGYPATELLRKLIPGSVNWPISSVTTSIVALSVLFLLVALTVRVIGLFVKGIAKKIKLGAFDKILGSALCTFKYVFLLSILLNFYDMISPDSSTFATRHMLDNKPFEATLDLVPAVLGAETMPSDSLKLYRDEIARADSIRQDSVREDSVRRDSIARLNVKTQPVKEKMKHEQGRRK
jgi:membrane protein required for colicin V production